MTFAAVYENGVLGPLESLALPSIPGPLADAAIASREER